MIDKPTIARIMDATKIEEVVSEFVTLKKRGVNYIGLCPFHNDSHPSFSVSPTRGICHCFHLWKGWKRHQLPDGAGTDDLSRCPALAGQEISHRDPGTGTDQRGEAEGERTGVDVHRQRMGCEIFPGHPAE